MKKFIIENEFWEVFPRVKIGIIICNNIDNSIKDKDKYTNLISNSKKESLKYLSDSNFSNNKVIQIWRHAFQKFKTKKGARSSIEALLKRVHSGNELGTINPLVDIYNSISLKYAFPCGGEDIDTFIGNVRLTKALGDEDFITLGSEKSEPPYENEIIYKDDKGAICRCFNWRESVRTMLTEETKNAFLCIEFIEENIDREREFESALKELANTVSEELNGITKIHILDIDTKTVEID